MLLPRKLGITMRWEGTGMDEVGIIEAIADGSKVTSFKPGQIVVRVDPRYFRPTEVQTLLGNPAKAKRTTWLDSNNHIQRTC